MMVLKCKICGGDVELSSDKTYGICSHCGNHASLKETKDEQKVIVKTIENIIETTSLERLIQNSNTYLKLGDYSSAKEVFKRITKEYPEDYRAWWGLIVCETKGFEIIKEDQSSISKWFNNVKQLTPEEEFSTYIPEFEEYIRKIANIDSENEISEIGDSVNDLNETIMSLDLNIEQIEQDKKAAKENYYEQIVMKDRDISTVNNYMSKPKEKTISKVTKKILSIVIKLFGAIFVLSAYISFFASMNDKTFPIVIPIIMAYIGSKCFLSYSASFLPVGLMLLFSKEEAIMLFGVNIIFFSGLTTWYFYRKSKKKENSEVQKIKAEIEAIEKVKAEITKHYEDYVSMRDKQIDTIKNHIFTANQIIDNCKKYLAYDKDKITDMFFALRCEDFGITHQFDNEIEKLREEIIDASNKHSEQVMNSVLHFQDNTNLL